MIRGLKYRKWIKVIRKSGLFDVGFYLSSYPDVRISDIDPIEHYVMVGANEGRNPSSNFNTGFYLSSYEDVKNSNLNPLVHYILHGIKEERKSTLAKVTRRRDDSSQSSPSKSTVTTSKKIPIAEGRSLFELQFQQNNSADKDYIPFKANKEIDTDLKLIAYYLPQFHPVPENDKSWGKGFTEWTNVTKALPQFEGHYQPRLAGELGYYDLRLKDVQKRQIELAKNYGLHGFCYHYYWFDGRKVMDQPLQQVLDNPDLDFPFCINWANENWTKKWDGLDQDVILAQKHSPEDDLAFLEAITPILKDKRYIKVDGKPLLMVYRPKLFPDIEGTVKRWRAHAKKNGIGELYLVLSHAFEHLDPVSIGFDAAAEFAPNGFQITDVTHKQKLFNKHYQGVIYDYEAAINYSLSYKDPKYVKFRSLCPGWDNEARKPGKGTSFINTSPAKYSRWLEHSLYFTHKHRKSSEKLIFINAWNEWAEGAYLEPDRKYGYAYLDETYNQLRKFERARLELIESSHGNKKTQETAIILHLYYIDLWDEIKSKLKHLDGNFDLYININNTADTDFIKQVRGEYPLAYIYSCENRGRDILPFVQMYEDVVSRGYKYACKIHSKKSPHRSDGDKWRNHLIESLLGSKERISQAKNLLDGNTGIVVAKGNLLSYREWAGSNEYWVSEFSSKANINMPDDFTFPAGTMFWFSPNVFTKLIGNIDISNFEIEKGQIDGAKAHAVERIFGLLCFDSNKELKEI